MLLHFRFFKFSIIHSFNFVIMKTTTISVLAILLAMSALVSAQNSITVLNFEDEDETAEIIDHLHTEDWQTNPAYTRNTFALNPKKMELIRQKDVLHFLVIILVTNGGMVLILF